MMNYFAVFGNPISHSLSPNIHNRAIAYYKLDAIYGRFHLVDENLLRNTLFKLNVKGANITAPFKNKAFEICDVLDDLSKKCKAVNTVLISDGLLYGYNTDASGFLKSIPASIKNALIMGAGGSAIAILQILKANGIKVDLVNRSKRDIDGVNLYLWKNYIPKGYDIVINATSAAHKSHDYGMPIELLEPTLRASKFAFDLVYDFQTPFLNLCEIFNIPCKNGLDMLLYQAALSFNIFHNKNFDIDEIYKVMRGGGSIF